MKRKSLFTGAAMGLAALAMSGCSSAAAPSNAADPAEITASQSECVEAAEEAVALGSAPMELIAPASALDPKQLEGRNIWYIAVGMNQFATDVADGIEAAGETLGMNVTVFDGQNQTNRFNEGIEQAIAQGADGIILLGIDPALVTNSLLKAEAAGIPVQNNLSGDVGDPVPAGAYGNLTSDYTGDGALAAEWAMADSDCQAHVLLLSSSGIPVWDKFANGAAEAIKDCTDCSAEILNIDAANVATSVGSQVQTALQRNPEINYIIAAWDSAVPFANPVIAASGSKPKVGARDGIEASIQMIAAGNGQDMTVTMPPTGWIGYIAVDDIARAILGEEQPGYTIPSSIIDAANVGTGSPEDVAPNYVDYPEAFEAAWTAK